MNSDSYKRLVAEAAINYLGDSRIIGVGTGSTVNHFIQALEPLKDQFEGVVSSSEASTALLKKIGIPVLNLNDTGGLDVYVDGADEANRHLQLIKGGGGALTREKIIAGASRNFVCIADDSKLVKKLGSFPLPVEVIPMARSYIARELVKRGGRPVLRSDFVTDNGNPVLDIHDLDISEPAAMEAELNNIPGVVTVGLFAIRSADILLLGGPDGVKTID